MKNTCDRCGQDCGTEGVRTVLLERRQDGGIEALPVRECRPCAQQQAREEQQ